MLTGLLFTSADPEIDIYILRERVHAYRGYSSPQLIKDKLIDRESSQADGAYFHLS